MIQVLEQFAQHEAMMLAHVAAQGLNQRGDLGPQLPQPCVQRLFNLPQRRSGMLQTPLLHAADHLFGQFVPLGVKIAFHFFSFFSFFHCALLDWCGPILPDHPPLSAKLCTAPNGKSDLTRFLFCSKIISKI